MRKDKENKENKYFKKPRYYVDGYVEKVPNWMTKKEAKKMAKKIGTPLFKSFEHAENYRMAGILGG